MPSEQGPILEEERAQVGVVHGAQAYKWFTLDIRGRACHTGTTPYRARSDALLLASRIMVANAALAQKHGGLASTVRIQHLPWAVSVLSMTLYSDAGSALSFSWKRKRYSFACPHVARHSAPAR